MTVLALGCQPGAPTGATTGAPKAAAPKEQAPAPAAGGGGTVRLGVIVERTGPLAAHGEAGQRGVELAVEELNAQGGLLGRRVETIIRDSKGQQDEATRQARDLLLNEKVDFLLHNINSAECLGVSDVAREARKIVFSQCGIDDFTAKMGHRYAFRIATPLPQVLGGIAAEYVAQNLKSVKTVATMGHDYSFGRAVVAEFKQRLSRLKPDVQYVGESWPAMTESDYSTYITTLQNQRADATFIFLANAVPFHNQVAPVGLHRQTTLLLPGWPGADEMATLRQESIPEGALIGGYPWYAIDNAENKQFVEKFRAKFNQPPRAASYFQHATLQFLSEAVKKAGTIDSDKVVDALEGMELRTAAGTARIRPFDHQSTMPHRIGKAKWDDTLKMGVLADPVEIRVEQLMPTEEEIKKLRGQ